MELEREFGDHKYRAAVQLVYEVDQAIASLKDLRYQIEQISDFGPSNESHEHICRVLAWLFLTQYK
jgi:hypothetical protein